MRDDVVKKSEREREREKRLTLATPREQRAIAGQTTPEGDDYARLRYGCAPRPPPRLALVVVLVLPTSLPRPLELRCSTHTRSLSNTVTR